MSENEHAGNDETVEVVGVDGDDPEGTDEGTVEETEETEETDEANEESPDGIPASDELAAALKEAEEAVDERQAKRSADEAPEAPESDDGLGSADKMTIELLSQELQSLKGEHEKTLASAAETEDKLLRLQAEFENFRRRTLKEKQDTFKYGVQNLVKDLLATVDNLERAVAHGEENQGSDSQSLLEGVDLVRTELLGILNTHGVKTIEAENKIFDPAVHEAMAQVENADIPANTVMQVLQAGYMLRDRILRPARVIVSKAVAGAAAVEAESDESQQDEDSSSSTSSSEEQEVEEES